MPLKMYDQNTKHSNSKIRYTQGVAAGKGGVGKSTVAVNLALALKQKGFSVGLMDTDIYGPSVRKILPEDRMPSQKGEIIIPALCLGIRMISMAYFRKDEEAAVIRAPIANGIINQFIQNVAWGDLDFLIIDFPPGTGDIQLTLSQKASLTAAVMVTTPQEIAIMDVRKAMHMFEQVNVPILGVVENMSGYLDRNTQEMLYLFGKDGGKKLAREAGVPFLGSVPIDPELNFRNNQGISIFSKDLENDCPSGAVFEKIAETVQSNIEALNQNDQQSMKSFELIWKEI